MSRSPDILSSEVLRHAAEQRLVMVDLGARGGVDEAMAALACATIAIGFEPNPQEAQRLQDSTKGPWLNLKIVPCAIGGSNGRSTLHVPHNAEGASLLPHNEDMVREFGQVALHRTIDRMPVSVVTLDNLMGDHGIEKADYLKIDIEGAEFDVLCGGKCLVDTCKVIKVECSFLEQRVGQPLAADVVSYLTGIGFELIDVLAMQRWRRRPLPAHPYTVEFDAPYSRGRVSQADFLFARRFAPGSDGWDVSAAILILTAMGYVDHAVTLLRRSPEAMAWWSSRGVDIEIEIKGASRRLGSRETRAAVWKQLRGLVPLVRSRLGMLPFRTPELRY